jgi:organic hydroperoxide reductase OsmC/OhrA
LNETWAEPARLRPGRFHRRDAQLSTYDQSRSLTIPPKATGFGSGANGGELLFLALATCYCNDIYREAEKQNIRVQSVEVTVEGDFGAPGGPARNVVFPRARDGGGR